MEDLVTRKKGVVTPLSSLFPVEESKRAANHVKKIISERHEELETLQQFIVDNSNIANLVSKLPDELHHDVMVPFGRAAFFPGQLVHSNEFMVLLGEGYFAERTAKQTVEILNRRGNVLNSQVEACKANIKDLKAEAMFFDASASEAAEGLVEIKEEYIEEVRHHLDLDEAKCAIKDDEFARIMSRLDELETVEIAANTESEGDETAAASPHKNSEEENVVNKKSSLFNESPFQNFLGSMPVAENSCVDYTNQLHVSDNSSKTKMNVQLGNPDGMPKKKNSMPAQTEPEAFTDSIVEHTDNLEISLEAASSKPSKPISRFKMQSRSRKD